MAKGIYVGVVSDVIVEKENLVEFTSNIIPTDWLNSNSTSAICTNDYGKWSVTATGTKSDYWVSDAFDGDGDSYWQSNNLEVSSSSFAVLTIQCPTGIQIQPTSIYIKSKYCGLSGNPNNVVQGYNVATQAWESIRSFYSDYNVTETTLPVSNGQWYSAFRVQVQAYSTVYYNPFVYEFQIRAGTLKTTSQVNEKKSVARKVTKAYVGVDSVARKVKKGYIGVGGVARPFYSTDKQLAYYGYITDKLVSKGGTHGGSVGDYALFAEGAGTTAMIAYSSSLVQTTPTAQSPNGRNGCSVVSVGTNKDYLLFAAGIIPVSYMSQKKAPVYDKNLTKGTDITLQAYRDFGASTSIAGYGLVGGGDSSNFTPSGHNTVEAIAPTLVTPTLLAEMTNSRTHLSATTIGNHALFCGGMYNSTAVNTIETYNSSLVKSTTLTMSEAKVLSLSAATKQYAVVLGGISVYNPQTVSYTVETISTSLVKGTLTNLEHGMYYGASTSLDEYAIFTGGYETTTTAGTRHNRVVAYGNNLVKKELTLGSVRVGHGAASTGNYAVILGGSDASGVTLTGEALQLIG